MRKIKAKQTILRSLLLAKSSFLSLVNKKNHYLITRIHYRTSKTHEVYIILYKQDVGDTFNVINLGIINIKRV